jgi:hypothetical protein
VSGDPFAPARRALLIGPAVALAGGALVYVGIAGDGLSWLLCVPGGVLALAGLLRLVGGATVLGLERRRKRLLREGVAATATVVSAREVRKQAGYPIYEMDLKITRPDGTETTAEKRGAIPPQYAGSVTPGTELPVRVDADAGSAFAVDWDSF